MGVPETPIAIGWVQPVHFDHKEEPGMCPEPDYTKHVGRLLIRRWGRRVLIDWRLNNGRWNRLLSIGPSAL